MDIARFPTVSDAFQVYLLDAESRNVSPRTLTTYEYRLGQFIAYCDAAGILHLHDITPTVLREFFAGMNRRGLAGYTQLGAYRDVRAFLNFCVREGWFEASPLGNVKAPRVEKHEPQVYTPEQVRQIILHAGSARNRAIVLVLLDTGLRALELCNLDGRDIDMPGGAVRVRLGKGRKDRTVYAGAHARRALARYFAERGAPGPDDPVFLTRYGDRLTYGALLQSMRLIADNAGFRVTAHTFRRTFATEALRNGWDIYTLRDAMGHEDITVLQHYVRIAGSDVERSQRTMGVADSLLRKKRR